MGALRRHKKSGFDFVSINVGVDMNPIEQVMKAIAWFRHQAAVAGKGTILLRRSLIGDELAAERLVALLPQGLPKGVAYHLVYLPENMAQPAVRAFRAWLLEAVGQEGATPASFQAGARRTK